MQACDTERNRRLANHARLGNGESPCQRSHPRFPADGPHRFLMRLTKDWGPLRETKLKSLVSFPWCSRNAGDPIPTPIEMIPLLEGLSDPFRSIWKIWRAPGGGGPSESVARCFAVVAAMVLSAEKFAGFGVDSDTFAVGPVVLRNAEGVAAGLERTDSLRRKASLDE